MPKHGTRLEKLETYPIQRLKGHLYYVDKEGYIWTSKMAHAKE